MPPVPCHSDRKKTTARPTPPSMRASTSRPSPRTGYAAARAVVVLQRTALQWLTPNLHFRPQKLYRPNKAYNYSAVRLFALASCRRPAGVVAFRRLTHSSSPARLSTGPQGRRCLRRGRRLYRRRRRGRPLCAAMALFVLLPSFSPHASSPPPLPLPQGTGQVTKFTTKFGGFYVAHGDVEAEFEVRPVSCAPRPSLPGPAHSSRQSHRCTRPLYRSRTLTSSRRMRPQRQGGARAQRRAATAMRSARRRGAQSPQKTRPRRRPATPRRQP